MMATRSFGDDQARAQETGLSPTRVAQLVRLFSSDKVGEAGNAAMALHRMVVNAGHDIHWLADAIVAVLVPSPAQEPQSQNEPEDDEWLPVHSVTLYVHHKATGGRPSVRVEYLTRIGKVVDWWAIEHGGYARDFAHQKWRALGGELPLPDTADGAVERQEELAQDVEIMVDTSGRYPEVIGQRQTGAAP